MSKIHGHSSGEAETATPQEELGEFQRTNETLSVRSIRKVRLPVTAQLGNCRLLVRDILQLQPGAVLHLDKLAGEMADICVCGLPLARGEVVVLGDVLHVRIAEIVGMSERESEDYA